MALSPTSDGLSNLLLDTLSRQDGQSLIGRMERVPMKLRQVLFEPGEQIEKVYFPLSGVVSLIATMGDGAQVEAGTVGREGMVGLSIFFGATMEPNVRAMTQLSGETLRIDAAQFRVASSAPGPLRSIMERYAQATFIQTTQSVACNRLHSLDERCARWLLMTHDRAARDEFLLTQEFLSEMLGVRRATVTVAAGMLQKAGFIQYRRGHIRVLDRKGLEASACECYQVITDAFMKLQKNGE